MRCSPPRLHESNGPPLLQLGASAMKVDLGNRLPILSDSLAIMRCSWCLAKALLLSSAAIYATVPTSAAPPAGGDGELTTARDQSGIVAEAVEALQTKAMNRGKVDWPTAKAEAMKRIAKGEYLQLTLEWLVSQLNDGHSKVLTPEEAKALAGPQQANGQPGAAKAGLPPPVAPSAKMVKSANDPVPVNVSI